MLDDFPGDFDDISSPHTDWPFHIAELTLSVCHATTAQFAYQKK